MPPARNRRRLAMAGLLALSMFSCSYSDKEDRKEDEKNKRTALTASPAMAAAGIGRAERLVSARGRPRSVGSPVPQRNSIVHSRA